MAKRNFKTSTKLRRNIEKYGSDFLIALSCIFFGGYVIGRISDISAPIRFARGNGDSVLVDGDFYEISNSQGKSVRSFQKNGLGLNYRDSLGRNYVLLEQGVFDDSVYTPFIEDSTMYFVKKEFEDIKNEENRERFKRKKLEGGL